MTTTTTPQGSVEVQRNYERELHARAADLEARADMLYSSLLAPSMKEDALRAEAAHLRAMAS